MQGKRKVNETTYNHCGNIPMGMSGYEWDTTTLPLEKNVALGDAEKLVEFLEFEASEWFGESISNCVIGRTV